MSDDDPQLEVLRLKAAVARAIRRAHETGNARAGLRELPGHWLQGQKYDRREVVEVYRRLLDGRPAFRIRRVDELLDLAAKSYAMPFEEALRGQEVPPGVVEFVEPDCPSPMPADAALRNVARIFDFPNLLNAYDYLAEANRDFRSQGLPTLPLPSPRPKRRIKP